MQSLNPIPNLGIKQPRRLVNVLAICGLAALGLLVAMREFGPWLLKPKEQATSYTEDYLADDTAGQVGSPIPLRRASPAVLEEMQPTNERLETDRLQAEYRAFAELFPKAWILFL